MNASERAAAKRAQKALDDLLGPIDPAPHMGYDEAVSAMADAALAFARHLANEQGAADSGTMKSLFASAWDEYEEREEDEFA